MISKNKRSIFIACLTIFYLFFGCIIIAHTEEEAVDGPETKQQQVEHHDVSEEPAALKVLNHSITVFRAPYRGFSPAQRAEIAARRINNIHKKAKRLDIKALHARIGDLEGYLILYNSQIAFALISGDINPLTGGTLQKAATSAAKNLREVILAEDEQRKLPVLLKDAGYALLSFLILIILCIGTYKVRNRIFKKYDKTPAHVKKFVVMGVDLRAAAVSFERNLLSLFFWALWLVLVYFWVIFVFSLFYYTEPWSQKLDHYLITTIIHVAKSFLEALPQLAVVVMIFLLARLINKFISGLLRKVEEGRIIIPWLDEEAAKASRRIITVLLWIFAFIVAYPYIPGSGTGVFKGISLFLGLMISLGSTGLVNQIMCGLVLVWSRAIKRGEYVKVGETQGVVEELGVLSTKIRTAYKQQITVPNAVMISDRIMNFSRLSEFDGAVPVISVSIGYDTPWRQVQALLKTASDNTEGVMKEPAPRVLQTSLDDFYVEYQLFVHIEPHRNIPAVISDLNSNVLDAFNEYGIQIMSPHFMDQPQKTMVVPKDKWFVAPAENNKT